MKHYELTYLISPKLSDEEARNLDEKVKGFIQEKGGLITESKLGRKIKLAYSIKKEGMAYLGNLNFHLAAENIENFKKALEREPQVLRFLLIAKKIPKEAPRVRFRPIIKKPTPSKKVELEEVEKKLEEILGE